MTNLMSRRNRPGRSSYGYGFIVALVLAAAIGLAAGPVLADNDHGNRGRNDQHGRSYGRNDHRDYGGYRAYDYYGGNRYVYAPPPVIYTPYAPPAIDFVFPINIR